MIHLLCRVRILLEPQISGNHFYQLNRRFPGNFWKVLRNLLDIRLFLVILESDPVRLLTVLTMAEVARFVDRCRWALRSSYHSHATSCASTVRPHLRGDGARQACRKARQGEGCRRDVRECAYAPRNATRRSSSMPTRPTRDPWARRPLLKTRY